MLVVKAKLKTILEKNYDLNEEINFTKTSKRDFSNFLKDKRNAALGDSLVNLIYSLVKSLTKGEVTGLKISDTILLNGFMESKLSKWLKLTGDKKDKGNAIEALILYVWLVYEFNLEEMVLSISLKLKKENFSTRQDEINYSSKAFASFFNGMNNLIQKK